MPRQSTKKNFTWNAKKELFLSDLVQAVGISGHCDVVAAVLKKNLQSRNIEIKKDHQDPAIFQAVVNPGKSKSVMVQAHMDAVGMRVSYIDERGFVYVRGVGGIDHLALKGHKVRILTKKGEIKGLIQGLPIHHATGENKNKEVALDRFFIRTQYNQLKNNPIEIGNPVVYDEPMGHLGGQLLVGPGFDNRLGCLMMAEIVRIMANEKNDFTLYGVASAGEEIGCRGIRAFAQRINPNLAIVLDVTNATDYPGADYKKFGQQKMGGGPILAVGYNTRTKFNEQLMEVARKKKIPFQLRAEDITPTDGREIGEAGIPTLVVRVPGCMLHTANDCVHIHDIEFTVNLITAFLRGFGREF